MEKISDKPEADDSQSDVNRPTTLTPFQKEIVEASREALAWAEEQPLPPEEEEIDYKDIVWQVNR